MTKRIRNFFSLLTLSVLAVTTLSTQHTVRAEEFVALTMQKAAPLAVGKTAPELKASNVKGESVPLCDAKAKFTVVAFLSTRCPCTARYLTRLQEVQKQFRDSVYLVGVNSNANEQAHDVECFIDAQKLTFPLLKDTDYSVLHALRARSTPEVFVLDSRRVVRYHGAIDDSLYGDKVKHTYLHDALAALTADKPLAEPDTKFIGCGIYMPQK